MKNSKVTVTIMSKSFINRKIATIVTILLILTVIFMGITSGEREEVTMVERWVGNIITPIQRAVMTPIHGIQDRVYDIANFAQLNQQNRELEQSLLEKEQELIEARLSESELEELRGLQEALNFVSSEDHGEPIAARIISKSHADWFNVFTINAGESHGVVQDSVVLSEQGLVGRIIEVGDNWSRVMSISDSNSAISFKVLRDTNVEGIVQGSVTDNLEGYLFDPRMEVEIGDQLVTSGQGIFPEGVSIGEVTEIGKSSDQLLDAVTVDPAVDFQKINRVLVMVMEKEE